MTAHREVIVAGAGIGGLTAAHALARGDWRVLVLERAPALGEVGAGLQLSPNATRWIEKLGLAEYVLPRASEPERLMIRGARSGSTLMRLPLGSAARARWGAPMLGVHRADLQRGLLDAIEADPRVELRTGATVAVVRQDANGVTIETEAGETHRAEWLVCADGVHSRLRDALGFPGAPFYSGRSAWRALAPAEAVPDFARERASNLWLGPRAHLVHYPLRVGALVNIVAITEEPWRESDLERVWSESGDARRLRAAFGDWCGAARDLLAGVDDWRRWPLFDARPLRSFVNGRVALLGDAAHPMLPFFAQGASQAIEDAGALAAALGRREDLRRALADYDRQRCARAARVQRASRMQGAIYHLHGPAALARDVALRALPPSAAMARFDWLYGHGL